MGKENRDTCKVQTHWSGAQTAASLLRSSTQRGSQAQEPESQVEDCRASLEKLLDVPGTLPILCLSLSVRWASLVLGSRSHCLSWKIGGNLLHFDSQLPNITSDAYGIFGFGGGFGCASVQAVMIKYHRPGGSSTTELYFSQSQRLCVLDHSVSMVEFWWELTSRF